MFGRKGAVVCAAVVFAAVALSGGVGLSAAAELQVVDADLADETIVEGEAATVTATVENVGNETDTFTVELHTEGDDVLNATDVEVAPNETRTVDFVQPFETPGTYRLAVNGVSAGTLDVTEAASAEFDVTSVTLSDRETAVGDEVTATAEIENTGDADGTYSAELAIDGTVEANKSVAVDAGETATVDFTPSFDAAGDYAIGVGDGPTKELTVSEPASFEVSNAQLGENTTLAGDDAVVAAEVTNVGDAEGTFTAGFRATGRDGTTMTVDTQSVTLASGESESVELRGAIEQPGEYDVRVNQTSAGTLTVKAPAELTVTEATLQDDVVSVGDAVDVTATVENAGDREESLPVTVAADGANKTTEEVTVPPGEDTRVRLTYSATVAGDYEITANGVSAGTLIVDKSATFQTTSASVEPERVLEGESAEVTATVSNNGIQWGTHTVTLVVDGEPAASEELEIGPGRSETVVFSPEFDTADEYAIAVNNETAGTLAVLEPADVSIRDTELSSRSIVAGESVTVTVDLANDGDVEGEFTTQLRDANGALGTDTRTVGPDASETVRFTRTFDTTGEYDLTVNNDSVGTLAVLEPADVSLGETTVSPRSVEVGESVELAVELRNDGEATVQRDLDIGLGDGTTVQRTADVPASGTTLTISHAYNATGEYTVTVDDATVANVAVVEPRTNAGSGGGGGSTSSGSSGSAGSAGSATTGGAEPTEVRSESDEAVTVEIEDATGERYDVAVDLDGPTASRPTVSVSSVGVDPSGDPEAYETRVGRPTAEPGGRDPVPRGETLGYMEFSSSLGAAKTSAATLRFTVDEEAIPGGLGQENVAVMRYADGEWTTADVAHGVEGDTHTVTLPHATPVAVVALEPGRVEVVESVVPADQVRVGYETTLRATVENPGDRRASRNLTVSVNGESVAEREVTLDPEENATVEIGFQPPESGTVSLEDNEVGDIALFGEDGEDGGTSTDSGTDEDVPGFGAVSAVIALLVTALAVRVRRS